MKDPYSVLAVRAAYNAEMTSHGLTPTMASPMAFRAIASFLKANDIDPKRWIRARHEAIAWRHRIPPSRLGGSAAFLERFRSFGEGRQAEAIADERRRVEVDTVGGLKILQERVKAEYQGDREVCEVMRDLTGGFKAESPWCSSCDRKEACRARG